MLNTTQTNTTFYTTRIAARELDTSETNVRKLANKGRLPFIRTAGGTRLFREDNVRKLAHERRASR